MTRIVVVIPALNEEEAIASVIRRIPKYVDRIIVADNGSVDRTADAARGAGAQVVSEPRAGYGRACLAGVDAAGECDVLVFLDGDGSDFPEQMDRLLDPIMAGRADFVIGSRALGDAAPGALTPPQVFGNRLASWLLGMRWGGRWTDLGPFRAIRLDAYRCLDMRAPTYGWTIEMQARALKRRLRVVEAPVDYAPRIGHSKISGTAKGVVLAGAYILGTFFREAVTP